MANKRPKVSIIVPNYNHAPYLQRRITSILNQTFEDYEVFLLDDASTDHSYDIIVNYEKGKNFRVFRNIVNSGNTFKQWNLGNSYACGKYIWIAESDDYSDPELLGKLVEVLDRNPKVGIVYCQSYIVNEKDEISGSHIDNLMTISKSRWKKNFILSGRTMLQKYMISINAIPNASAVLFRKKAYDDIGGAVEEMKLCGDWMTWCRILLDHHIGFIAEPLNYYRVHDLTVRTSFRSKPEYLIEYLQVIKYILKHVSISSRQMRETYRQVLKRWLKICLNPISRIDRNQLHSIFNDTHYIFGKKYAISFLVLGIMAPFLKIIKRIKETK